MLAVKFRTGCQLRLMTVIEFVIREYSMAINRTSNNAVAGILFYRFWRKEKRIGFTTSPALSSVDLDSRRSIAPLYNWLCINLLLPIHCQTTMSVSVFEFHSLDLSVIQTKRLQSNVNYRPALMSSTKDIKDWMLLFRTSILICTISMHVKSAVGRSWSLRLRPFHSRSRMEQQLCIARIRRKTGAHTCSGT